MQFYRLGPWHSDSVIITVIEVAAIGEFVIVIIRVGIVLELRHPSL